MSNLLFAIFLFSTPATLTLQGLCRPQTHKVPAFGKPSREQAGGTGRGEVRALSWKGGGGAGGAGLGAGGRGWVREGGAGLEGRRWVREGGPKEVTFKLVLEG